jgi:hypothetical protein
MEVAQDVDPAGTQRPAHADIPPPLTNPQDDRRQW